MIWEEDTMLNSSKSVTTSHVNLYIIQPIPMYIHIQPNMHVVRDSSFLTDLVSTH